MYHPWRVSLHTTKSKCGGRKYSSPLVVSLFFLNLDIPILSCSSRYTTYEQIGNNEQKKKNKKQKKEKNKEEKTKMKMEKKKRRNGAGRRNWNVKFSAVFQLYKVGSIEWQKKNARRFLYTKNIKTPPQQVFRFKLSLGEVVIRRLFHLLCFVRNRYLPFCNSVQYRS